MVDTIEKLTPAEVKREALGRSIAMIGSTVGLVGTALLLSVNPTAKRIAGKTYAKLPDVVKKHQVIAGIAVAGLIVYGVVWWYKRKK